MQTFRIRVWKKENKWLRWFSDYGNTIISILLATITLVALIYANHYSDINVDLQRQNLDLQNSLYNYKPFIFANTTETSTLQTLLYDQNGSAGLSVFSGYVHINLKVITPYDGLVTVRVKAFNYTYLNALGIQTSRYLRMDALDSTYIADMSGEPHQYFVYKDIANSIEDQIYVHLQTPLKPHILGPDVKSATFRFGDVVFGTSLFEVRPNNTTELDDFYQPISIKLLPVSP
ncbi:MAG: hypothetical protein ACE14S_08085 [Candidatus Bathyarchaeia archaeon]